MKFLSKDPLLFLIHVIETFLLLIWKEQSTRLTPILVFLILWFEVGSDEQVRLKQEWILSVKINVSSFHHKWECKSQIFKRTISNWNRTDIFKNHQCPASHRSVNSVAYDSLDKNIKSVSLPQHCCLLTIHRGDW